MMEHPQHRPHRLSGVRHKSTAFLHLPGVFKQVESALEEGCSLMAVPEDQPLEETIAMLHKKNIQLDDQRPFYVVDLSVPARLYEKWNELLPRVSAHYAVKCNPDPGVVAVLAACGASFDCASSAEVDLVLGFGVRPSRIVYANPCKAPSEVLYAKKVGVSRLTIDNEDEITKIAVLYPEAEVVLRLSTQGGFSSKFGADPAEAKRLVNLCKQRKVNLVGVSFHVGTACRDLSKYTEGMLRAYEITKYAKEIGFEMMLVDIGGGFPGSHGDNEPLNEPTDRAPFFRKFADHINFLIDSIFAKEKDTIDFIAEPGRYFAAQVTTLAAAVIGRRPVTLVDPPSDGPLPRNIISGWKLYLSDGVYGSMNNALTDHVRPAPHVLFSKDANISSPHAQEFPTTMFGPTCDSLDKIVDDVRFPEVHIGDWVFFRNFGAYTQALVTRFNGFPPPAKYYVMTMPVSWFENGEQSSRPVKEAIETALPVETDGPMSSSTSDAQIAERTVSTLLDFAPVTTATGSGAGASLSSVSEEPSIADVTAVSSVPSDAVLADSEVVPSSSELPSAEEDSAELAEVPSELPSVETLADTEVVVPLDLPSAAEGLESPRFIDAASLPIVTIVPAEEILDAAVPDLSAVPAIPSSSEEKEAEDIARSFTTTESASVDPVVLLPAETIPPIETPTPTAPGAESGVVEESEVVEAVEDFISVPVPAVVTPPVSAISVPSVDPAMIQSTTDVDDIDALLDSALDSVEVSTVNEALAMKDLGSAVTVESSASPLLEVEDVSVPVLEEAQKQWSTATTSVSKFANDVTEDVSKSVESTGLAADGAIASAVSESEKAVTSTEGAVTSAVADVSKGVDSTMNLITSAGEEVAQSLVPVGAGIEGTVPSSTMAESDSGVLASSEKEVAQVTNPFVASVGTEAGKIGKALEANVNQAEKSLENTVTAAASEVKATENTIDNTVAGVVTEVKAAQESVRKSVDAFVSGVMSEGKAVDTKIDGTVAAVAEEAKVAGNSVEKVMEGTASEANLATNKLAATVNGMVSEAGVATSELTKAVDGAVSDTNVAANEIEKTIKSSVSEVASEVKGAEKSIDSAVAGVVSQTKDLGKEVSNVVDDTLSAIKETSEIDVSVTNPTPSATDAEAAADAAGSKGPAAKEDLPSASNSNKDVVVNSEGLQVLSSTTGNTPAAAVDVKKKRRLGLKKLFRSIKSAIGKIGSKKKSETKIASSATGVAK